MEHEKNILDFISSEHHNQLASIANLKAEFDRIGELDTIFYEALHGFTADSSNDVQIMVCAMYSRACGEFYGGMSQFLRSHLGKAFVSLRIAIDAALNAYYFINNPAHTKEYVDHNSPFQKTRFNRMKDHISKNIKAYPLAAQLIKVHEAASAYSAHASTQSFAYKYEHIKGEGGEADKIKINHFDDLSPEQFMAYYFNLLKGFFIVFELFHKIFFKKEKRIEYPERDQRIEKFQAILAIKHKQYPIAKP